MSKFNLIQHVNVATFSVSSVVYVVCRSDLVQKIKIPTHKTEPLFSYRPILTGKVQENLQRLKIHRLRITYFPF